MDNIDTTTAVEAISEEVRAQRAIRVIQHQVQHGSSVRQACEACNVPVWTFYHWMREGVLTDYVGASRDSRSTVASALAIEAIPDVMQYIDPVTQIAISLVLCVGFHPTSPTCAKPYASSRPTSARLILGSRSEPKQLPRL